MGLFKNRKKKNMPDAAADAAEESAGASVAAAKKSRKGLAPKIGAVAVAAFLIYAAVLIISTEAELNEQEAVLSELKDQITAAEQENDEYKRILGGEDENAYMEKIAIEKMGYAYPNEKRYYIKESN